MRHIQTSVNLSPHLESLEIYLIAKSLRRTGVAADPSVGSLLPSPVDGTYTEGPNMISSYLNV